MRSSKRVSVEGDENRCFATAVRDWRVRTNQVARGGLGHQSVYTLVSEIAKVPVETLKLCVFSSGPFLAPGNTLNFDSVGHSFSYCTG